MGPGRNSQHGKENIASQWLKQGQWPRKSKKFWEHVDSILPDIKYFEFTGGEPFLIKQHFDLLERAAKSGYAKILIFTITQTVHNYHLLKYLIFGVILKELKLHFL